MFLLYSSYEFVSVKNPPPNCQPPSFPRLTITTFVTFISFTSSFARVFPPWGSHIGDAFWDACQQKMSKSFQPIRATSKHYNTTISRKDFLPLQPQSPKSAKSWVSKTCEKTAPFERKKVDRLLDVRIQTGIPHVPSERGQRHFFESTNHASKSDQTGHPGLSFQGHAI